MNGRARAAFFVLGLLVLGLGSAMFGRTYAGRPANKAPLVAAAADVGSQTARAARPRQAEVPRFVTYENPKGDPRSPEYDPSSLVQHGERLTNLFEREPRDEKWAAAMERAMLAPVTGDLKAVIPGIDNVTIECKTAVCKLRWTTQGEPTKVEDARVNAVLTQVYGGSALSRVVNNTAFLAYAGGPTPFATLKGQADEAAALLLQNRSHRLARLRAGTVPELLTKPVAPNEWPAP